jgi:hypothetical protein
MSLWSGIELVIQVITYRRNLTKQKKTSRHFSLKTGIRGVCAYGVGSVAALCHMSSVICHLYTAECVCFPLFFWSLIQAKKQLLLTT